MTTRKERIEVIDRLIGLGFSYDESETLRRIAMTFSRWDEAECNGEIQRDESTGIPYRYVNPGMSERRYRIPDRENGAYKRLNRIMEEHRDLWAYRQGDPRGASLYIGRIDQMPEGYKVENCYSSFGVAVY